MSFKKFAVYLSVGMCLVVYVINTFYVNPNKEIKKKPSSQVIVPAGKLAGNGEYKGDIAVLLSNEKILLVGGNCDKKAEIYDPKTKTSTPLSPPNFNHFRGKP